MVDVNKLRGKLAERRMSFEQLASKMDLSTSTIYRKINENGETITVVEANKIVEILELDPAEAMSIFFSQFVA